MEQNILFQVTYDTLQKMIKKKESKAEVNFLFFQTFR